MLKIGNSTIVHVDGIYVVVSPETPSKHFTKLMDAVKRAVIEEWPDEWSEELFVKSLDEGFRG